MRIIDFHTHTFPDRIAAAALNSLKHDSETVPHTEGTNSDLRRSMDEAGVDISIVLPVVTNPAKSSSMNNYAARINEEFEQTGIFSIGGIHPESPNIREVIREAADLGLKGLKLHPDYYGIEFNDIRIKRVVDIASENGLFIITHAGMDIGLYPPICCSIASIMDVMKDVRPEALVLAHMGGWMNWEEVTEVLGPFCNEYNNNCSGRGVYLDTAFSIGEIEWLDPDSHKAYHQMSDDQFRRMVETFGSDRILFATDSPWAEQRDYVDRIYNMGLTPPELEQIFHENAEHILGL